MNRKKKILIIVACVVIALPILYFPTKVIIGGVLACKEIHDNLRLEKQDEIDATNKINIFTSEEPKSANVSTHGGCDGINPLGITISKTYERDINAKEALTSVRNSLNQANYTITSENFGSEGCKAIYRVNATNGNVKMYVALSQDKHKITGCTDGYPTGISEQVFVDQTLDKALVTPKCGSSNCL